MQSQFDLLGAFVPTIAAWFVLSLAVFVPVDALLTRRGFYRLFWHAPLARFALFVCLFCGGALAVSQPLKEVPMQAVVRVLLTLILLVAAGLLSYDMASYYLYSPWTRDARVRANVVTVAPDVSGYVDDIRVRNNQFVHKDDVLFVIDQDRYQNRARKRRSRARGDDTLSISCCSINTSGARSWLPGTRITVEALDNARRQSETAAANYQQAIASRDTAALNLKRTEVRASVNGFITNLNLAKGTYASQGQAGDGADRQRFISGRSVFRGNQDPADQTRRHRRDLPHGRIPRPARNRPGHSNGHHGSG